MVDYRYLALVRLDDNERYLCESQHDLNKGDYVGVEMNIGMEMGVVIACALFDKESDKFKLVQAMNNDKVINKIVGKMHIWDEGLQG